MPPKRKRKISLRRVLSFPVKVAKKYGVKKNHPTMKYIAIQQKKNWYWKKVGNTYKKVRRWYK